MPLSLRLITYYHLSVACARDFPCTQNLHNYPHKKKSAHIERSMRHIFPDYPRRFETIEHPSKLRRQVCSRAIYRNLTNSNFSVALSLTITIHIFFRVQLTIFPYTIPPQLFRWLYILNVFPCVKYNFSIHILYTIFHFARDLPQSIFRVCILCVIFSQHLTIDSRNACALIFPYDMHPRFATLV